MSLDKKTADRIADTLAGEFNGSASVRVQKTLAGTFKVYVDHDPKAPLNVLENMQKRARAVAGQDLDRDALEFKSGANF